MKQAGFAPYRVRTHNASEHSENRMHSDDVARRFGFKGALVPGVTVFAHMTRPLVERYGERWLGQAIAEVTFAKPAYEGDLLTIAPPADANDSGPGQAPEARPDGDAVDLTCRNEEGVELARMRSHIPQQRPAVDPRSDIAPAPPSGERPLVTWELMEVGQPFPALRWAPTQADNLQWCDDVGDDLPLYRTGATPPIHPGFVLRQANFVLRNRFTLPAWIHTASRIVFHAVLRVGGEYEVRAIPEEKWQRKGHELVRLYVAIRQGGSTLGEISHTAIFRPRT
jgi:hypothetical protein